MARIFSVLAVLALLLLAANFVVGLLGGDFNAAARGKRAAQRALADAERQARAAKAPSSPAVEQAKADLAKAGDVYQQPRSRMTLHMLLGSAAALVTVLVNSIAVTYFIGTSRWCKEVCETYALPAELAERSTTLKRKTFPWALAGILTMIVLVGFGAAADPTGANFERSESFVLPHYVLAMAALVICAAAFWMEISRIAENYGVIEEILAEVARIRESRQPAREEVVAP